MALQYTCTLIHKETIVKSLGECRTLWGEREQAACILATEERMKYQTLLSVSNITIAVGSLWWHILALVQLGL